MKTTKLFLFAFTALLLLSSCEKDYFDAFVSRTDKIRSASYPLNPANQPNIVIMGDGYTTSDLMPGGAFETAANSMVDKLFSVKPFNDQYYKTYFNIYFVYVASQEQGIGHGKAKNTAFRCFHYANNPEILEFEDTNSLGIRKAANPFDMAKQAVPGIDLANTIVVVLANDSEIGFTTGHHEKNVQHWLSAITVSSDPEQFQRLVLREVGGKGFARLAQEDGDLLDYDKTIRQAYIKSGWEQYGFYANIDITDDPAQVKWKHFLRYPEKYPELGVYPGGFGHSTGSSVAFHPDQDNVMLRDGDLRYDAPSREAIIKRIRQINKDPYTEETFKYLFVENNY